PCVFSPPWFFLSPMDEGLAELRQHVRLTQDEQVVPLDGYLGASVFGVEDLVALRDVERAAAAVLVDGAIADGDDLPLLRLLLGGVGENDAASGRRLLLDRLDDQPVPEGLQLHPCTSVIGACFAFKSRIPAAEPILASREVGTLVVRVPRQLKIAGRRPRRKS